MVDGQTQVAGRFWLVAPGGAELGAERIALLEAIAAHGSIAAAARVLGMSYRAAWGAVEAASRVADSPLVERQAGGHSGGATRLTGEGRRLVDTYRRMEREYQRFLAGISGNGGEAEHRQRSSGLPAVRTSARNLLRGRVFATLAGPVDMRVSVAVSGTQLLTALITRASFTALGLAVGEAVYALVKASAVTPCRPASAAHERDGNCLRGTLEYVLSGPDNSEVLIGLDDGQRLTAVTRTAPLQALDLRQGARICARIDPGQVLLGVD